jgi:hypothetical protein
MRDGKSPATCEAKMKHYIYISDTKINMLFAQIPPTFLSTLSAEVSINIGVVKASVKEKMSEQDRYSKLSTVLAFLDNGNKIGPLGSTSAYVRDTLKMKWGLFEQTGFVFFTGKQGKTIVGLGGSLGHVVGSEQVAPLTHSNWGSACVGMERSLSAELDISPFIARVDQDTDANAGDESNCGLGNLIGCANRLVDGSLATCEFVALRFANSGFEDFNVVVGTPLYVAYTI